jgi:hypothetical protein
MWSPSTSGSPTTGPLRWSRTANAGATNSPWSSTAFRYGLGRVNRPVSLDVVEAWVEEACRAYHAPLVYDPFQAAHLAQQLRRRGIRIVEHTFTQASTGKLAVTLYQLLREHLLDLPDDERLVDELASVRLAEWSPGSYRIDHDAGAHDDITIALAMASSHLVDKGGGRPARGYTAAALTL